MVLGPAWTRGEIEPPAGTKNMGTWTASVYSPEQQARLGVDENGKKLSVPAKAAAPATVVPSAMGMPQRAMALPPLWVTGGMEKPAGTKDMGTFKQAVYTPEQQARLGVDEFGTKLVAAAAQAVSKTEEPQASLPTLTPEYLAALESSETLFADLCKQHFRKYDANKDGLLELTEIAKLCKDLHISFGMSMAKISDQAISASIKPFAGGKNKDCLAEEEFPPWFREILKDSAKTHVEKQEPKPAEVKMLSIKVKSMSGSEKLVEVPSSFTGASLAEAAAAALDLPYAQTKISIDGKVLPDSALLSSCDLGTDPEVVAVVMSTIKVKRHVYNMRGGAPPYRGYHLVASDEVELLPASKISEQLDKLVPYDRFGDSDGSPLHVQPLLHAFQATPSGEVPKKWEGGMNEVEIGPLSTPAEVFGVDGHVELAVLAPMRGMD
mmetsp:Transcript_53836/g.125532  ORF Transcript_53836/g.125532 Transcript_53836/m.125532 type:complete len:437 (-) Transcript_53836:94-1404(-)